MIPTTTDTTLSRVISVVDTTLSLPESSSESKLGCTHKLVPLEDDNDTNIVATYDPRGKYIYTGISTQ